MIKRLTSLPLFFYILICSTNVSAQNLDKKITLNVKDKTLQELFEHIGKEMDVTFSYMNNELPDKTITAKFNDKSLEEILKELLPEYNLVEHAGQIVLIRKTGYISPINEEVAKPIRKDTIDTIPSIPANAPVSDSGTVIINLQTEQDEVSIPPSYPNDTLKADSTGTTEFAVDNNLNETLGKEGQVAPGLQDTISIEEKVKKRIFHVGLFYPISTNGPNADEFVNNFSFNVFTGKSKGFYGLEYSSLVNTAFSDGNGVQIAGLANVVKGDLTGSQISGAVNVVDKSVRGLQVAGITNFVKESQTGVQMSLATNVVKGETSGFQFSAVNFSKGQAKFGQAGVGLNIAKEVNGPQIAGIMNVQNGKGNGLQMAGFMNKAGSINGMQLAGFLNMSEKTNGLQASGFLNMAKSVKGVQLGVINIADSLTGVPIGLFSLVKKNGYYDLELFYAEDFQANAIIKLGAQKFHNLFGISYETNYKNRWAYGYGFGAQWGKKIFRLNTDAITYYVIEQEFPNGVFKDYQLNLLSKFKLLASAHFNNLGIFGGPIYNVMVSRHTNPESDVVGSDIAPNPIFNQTNRFNTNVKMWIGYNVGIRF